MRKKRSSGQGEGDSSMSDASSEASQRSDRSKGNTPALRRGTRRRVPKRSSPTPAPAAAPRPKAATSSAPPPVPPTSQPAASAGVPRGMPFPMAAAKMMAARGMPRMVAVPGPGGVLMHVPLFPRPPGMAPGMVMTPPSGAFVQTPRGLMLLPQGMPRGMGMPSAAAVAAMQAHLAASTAGSTPTVPSSQAPSTSAPLAPPTVPAFGTPAQGMPRPMAFMPGVGPVLLRPVATMGPHGKPITVNVPVFPNGQPVPMHLLPRGVPQGMPAAAQAAFLQQQAVAAAAAAARSSGSTTTTRPSTEASISAAVAAAKARASGAVTPTPRPVAVPDVTGIEAEGADTLEASVDTISDYHHQKKRRDLSARAKGNGVPLPSPPQDATGDGGGDLGTSFDWDDSVDDREPGAFLAATAPAMLWQTAPSASHGAQRTSAPPSPAASGRRRRHRSGTDDSSGLRIRAGGVLGHGTAATPTLTPSQEQGYIDWTATPTPTAYPDAGSAGGTRQRSNSALSEGSRGKKRDAHDSSRRSSNASTQGEAPWPISPTGDAATAPSERRSILRARRGSGASGVSAASGVSSGVQSAMEPWASSAGASGGDGGDSDEDIASALGATVQPSQGGSPGVIWDFQAGDGTRGQGAGDAFLAGSHVRGEGGAPQAVPVAAGPRGATMSTRHPPRTPASPQAAAHTPAHAHLGPGVMLWGAPSTTPAAGLAPAFSPGAGALGSVGFPVPGTAALHASAPGLPMPRAQGSMSSPSGPSDSADDLHLSQGGDEASGLDVDWSLSFGGMTVESPSNGQGGGQGRAGVPGQPATEGVYAAAPLAVVGRSMPIHEGQRAEGEGSMQPPTRGGAAGPRAPAAQPTFGEGGVIDGLILTTEDDGDCIGDLEVPASLAMPAPLPSPGDAAQRGDRQGRLGIDSMQGSRTPQRISLAAAAGQVPGFDALPSFHSLSGDGGFAQGSSGAVPGAVGEAPLHSQPAGSEDEVNTSNHSDGIPLDTSATLDTSLL